jgi:dTDP-4-amino-4,6-dideoxygalactose transaminase
MTDVQAAMGREQLKRLPSILARRRERAARYTAQLRGVTPPHQPTWARSNWQSYAVQLSPQHDQQTVMQAMLDDGIATRRGVMCSHREQACADLPLRHDLSASEHAQDHSIILPLYPQMTDDEQDRVITSLHHALHA